MLTYQQQSPTAEYSTETANIRSFQIEMLLKLSYDHCHLFIVFLLFCFPIRKMLNIGLQWTNTQLPFLVYEYCCNTIESKIKKNTTKATFRCWIQTFCLKVEQKYNPTTKQKIRMNWKKWNGLMHNCRVLYTNNVLILLKVNKNN